MADPITDRDKITILLADEDALRRDGLAAVLGGTAHFQIVAQCPEGESALEKIRSVRPHVAVVDLNLPRIHGIELIRRVRAEAPGTRIIIMSGTTDDEIIREVVRAGGDGYLLKNGPARHLVDAISYVRDGGQYFSPQLRRDGLDRHLLEEPPRTPVHGVPPARPAPANGLPAAGSVTERLARSASDLRGSRDDDHYPDADFEEDEPGDRPAARSASRPLRDLRGGRSRRPVRRPAEPPRLRERLREETDGNLGDRDYEILNMMAEGIKPILDRLEEIEGRVIGMETGDVPVPSDVRGWLDNQMEDTFHGGAPYGARPGGMAIGRTVQDLEARLPKLIEEAVTTRFQQMAGKLQEEIEDTHIRTLETFVKNIQVKLVARVSALETDMGKQAEAVQQLREYSQRTEDNLGRLISGVDRLAQELPMRLALPAPGAVPGEDGYPAQAARPSRRRSGNLPVKIFWACMIAVVIAGGIMYNMRRTSRQAALQTPKPAPTSSETLTKPAELSAGSDTTTKLQAAQEYADRKDYATAEDIYKQILKAEPANVDAMKALASVLYREDKIEESAAILEKLPKNESRRKKGPPVQTGRRPFFQYFLSRG